MNKTIIIGRLTADPELRQSQSGVATLRFTVAVNRKYKNQDGSYDADFIPCIAFRQTAEFISRYFSKGSMICVEGSLRTGSYTDKKYPDVKHYTVDLYVDSVEFVGSKSENSSNNSRQASQPAPAAQSIVQAAQSAGIVTNSADDDFMEIITDGEVPF